MACPIGSFENEDEHQNLEAVDDSITADSGNGSSSDNNLVSKQSDATINPSRSGYYRWTFLTIWIIITVIMVLDRFFPNVWPRQSFSGPPCNGKCGGDFFCGPGGKSKGPIGCLQPGPWGAKIFDILARSSARIIISTTNLMFLTVSHCTWNFLSERKFLKPYLYDWRTDNLWLHTVGGWTLGVWTIAHVYSLFLPSIFNGFRNAHVTGKFGWPAQIPLAAPQIDSDLRVANFGSDDIWRLFWMSVLFFIIFPVSRSLWGLRKNFSLAMWLHIGAGAGFFIDSARRRTHPHVWILNLPFVAWYIADRIASVWFYRADRNNSARRIMLDKNYMLLLWKQDRFYKSVCDLYWLKERFLNRKRASEWSHPFTTASAHYIKVQEDNDNNSKDLSQSMIEIPHSTDTTWEGHRFPLKKHNCNSCGESSKIIRINTLEYHQKRSQALENSTEEFSWDIMAIMRIQREGKPSKLLSLPRWLVNALQKSCALFGRSPETVKIAERDVENNPGGSILLHSYGPYRSAYGRLSELPNLAPLIIVGTGAGAALCLDVVAYIREHGIELEYSIQLYYSASSLPLLQFVTNNLLATKIPGLSIQTALTRNPELEFEDSEDEGKKGQLQLRRFNVKDIISQATEAPKTEVYFCGAGKINEALKKECSKRKLKYVGSSVA